MPISTNQCCRSMTFWSGSGDPCLWLIDLDPNPDHAIFVIDLQDANKKLILKSFSAYYFLKVHFHHFQRYISIIFKDKSQNSRNQGFSNCFCLMIQGSEPLLLMDAYPQHCYKYCTHIMHIWNSCILLLLRRKHEFLVKNLCNKKYFEFKGTVQRDGSGRN